MEAEPSDKSRWLPGVVPTDPSEAMQQPPAPPASGPGRKKGTACARCRSQKIRCDDQRPSCSNCARTGNPCVRSSLANIPDAVSHITQMEARLRFLEDFLRRVAPEELERAPSLERSQTKAQAQAESEFNTIYAEPMHTTSLTTQAVPEAFPHTLVAEAQMQHSTGEHYNHHHEGLDRAPLISGNHDFSSPISGRHHHHSSRHHHRVFSASSSDSPGLTSLSPTPSSQIGPSEPLAHEVGLLSLANSRESKYVGPSSGVPFARLIFSAIPQSQGLPTSLLSSKGSISAITPSQAHPFHAHRTSEVDLQQFVDTYFETLHPFYPFLDEDAAVDMLENLCTTTSQNEGPRSLSMPPLAEIEATLAPFDSVQIFLIIALGARILEVRLSTDFSSERYFATAMQRVGTFALHDSIPGLQIMLLLALSSFYFENGPNAWFLVANIIASCQDLGLQRRSVATYRDLPVDERQRALVHDNLRRGVFWSGYSLERTLAVVLGRPLTLRDEAIDIEFPGLVPNGPHDPGTADDMKGEIITPDYTGSSRSSTKRARMTVEPYCASQFSFRFDQTTAEIKLMLYRVANLPTRFPWPTDLDTWQKDVHIRCDSLLKNLRTDLRRNSRRGSSVSAIRTLELKYHHCLMLLYRPSPAIAQPQVESWKICYHSAVETILINSDLHRFSKLSNSWLTAHEVFVSGITFLYCLWVRPEIQQETTLDTFTSHAKSCTKLLKYLARTWSVAADAVEKFERLAQLTEESWKAAESQNQHSAEVAAGQSLLSISQTQDMHSSHRTGPEKESGGIDLAFGLQPPTIGPDASAMPDGDEAVTGGGGGGGGGGVEFEAESFFNELGDMSNWFDLTWMMDNNIHSP